MVLRKTTKTLAALLLAVLLGCALMLPALAAGGDITDYLREALQTDAASITLYTPTEAFSSCGEILYSDETGAMQLAVSGEEVVPLQSATLSTESVYTPPEGTDEASSWDGETPYVRPGYVLVLLRAEGRDDYMACLAKDYTVSAAQRQAQREAEEAARMAQEAETQETSTEEETEPISAPAATAEPIALPEKTAKKTLSDRLDALSDEALVLLVAVLVLGAAVLVELALLVVYKRRAENVAKNYLRSKAALDAGKRELSALRSKSLRLERELMQEREKMNAVRDELEKMQNRRAKKTPPEQSPEAPQTPPETSDGYDLDYLNWML